MNYNFSELSSIGSRDSNEDTIQVKLTGNQLLAIVADGLGGEKNGALASRTAVQAVNKFIEQSPFYTSENIDAAINDANESVVQAQGESDGMKTTIVLLYMAEDMAICGHLGDSRLYQFREKEICFQTLDHSVSQMAVNVGEILPAEIRGHPDRNKLLRALGSKQKMSASTEALPVQKGDGFLLCSDGFWELILEEEMEEDFINSHSSQEWLDKMRKRVESRLDDRSDNYSAVVILVD